MSRMTPLGAAVRRARQRRAVGGPLSWTFDGPFETCLADIDDTLRRALVQVGDVGAIAVRIELSLPALRRRVQEGDRIQPAWRDFIARVTARYGLPSPPQVRPMRRGGPLAVLVVAYRP